MRQQEALIRVLEEKQLDAILICDPYNIRYFSGFTGGEGYLYCARNQQVLLTDFRYTIQAQQESKTAAVQEVSAQYGYVDQIKALCDADQVRNLGIEEGAITYATFLNWQSKWDNIQMVPIKNALTQLRSVKTEEELALLEQAEAIGDQVFKEMLSFLRPGLTELQVAAKIEFLMKEYGAQGVSFDTIVASGERSALCHATSSEKKLASGEFVLLDFGCRYQGYCSDMTRTVVLGKASEKQKEIYEIVKTAQQHVLDKICAGVTGKEMDAIARNEIAKAGYSACFGHSLGHSVGLQIHENPRLSPTEETVLQEHMVETVEPGIYIQGFGGVRIEDMIVLTKTGYRNFTKSEKQLIELS